MHQKTTLAKLLIDEGAFVAGYGHDKGFLWDFRKVIMKGKVADIISELFYEQYKDEYPFQICTIEIAGVPLMTSIVNKFYQKGYRDMNGFFIRKSRKKTGLTEMIEGQINEDVPVIVIDDLINRGGSMLRQIDVLQEHGHKVIHAWSILRFRNLEQYGVITNRGILLSSLFSLDDFTDSTDDLSKNLPADAKLPTMNDASFRTSWVFKPARPSLDQVVQKSQPTIDNNSIYFGSDEHYFWSIKQSDGSVAWKFKVHAIKGKAIYSDPLLHGNEVYFGAYDGNVYCLNKMNGSIKWVFRSADYVGSSPDMSLEHNLLYIGMEFGLINKRGGIAAIDMRTGVLEWSDYSHQGLTHASPTYIRKHDLVVIGSNEGMVYAYRADTGIKVWQTPTPKGAQHSRNNDSGFGEGSIKGRVAYDPSQNIIVVADIHGAVMLIEPENGSIISLLYCELGIWGSPYVHESMAYVSSIDKHVYCIDLKERRIVWKKNIDNSRIFCDPVMIEGSLFIGTNAGKMYELNPSNGNVIGYFQTLERIVNNPVYNEKTNTFYLPTYANEIIALRRVENSTNVD